MSIQLAQQFDVPARSAYYDRPREVVFDPCEIRFSPHRMTRQYPSWVEAPRPGELHLWRFRSGWLPVSIQEGDQWLSEAERERARLNPNSALRKRFVGGRVVLRWIVANLFNTTPHEVQFIDGPADGTSVQLTADGHPVTIDIAYGGIWIVIAIASSALGLGVTMPAPGGENVIPEVRRTSIWPSAEPDCHEDRFRYAEESVQAARFNSLSNALKRPSIEVSPQALRDNAVATFVDLPSTGRWHIVDVPMPGKIRAAVSVAQPVTRIQAFGWPKN
ncbi:hypothetical protein SAMN05443245_3652 [Paraburkholderia fungorum]|uniref:Uncharacterized protein n=1 Tax=Paraburkholderia fungorum TaxID=134537 RepID=A0A1H1H8Y5_9BURK|nr:hypothetical protein [Paraburkholderia fungorum]SDR21965.1 hypothetical protein SAMN05443245_3652 [Paraburkholderia fungorum]